MDTGTIRQLKKYQSISDLLESLGYRWDGSHFERGNNKIAWERIRGRTVGSFVDETLQHDEKLLEPIGGQLAAHYPWPGIPFI